MSGEQFALAMEGKPIPEETEIDTDDDEGDSLPLDTVKEDRSSDDN